MPAGLIVVLVGAALAALSVFVLDWVGSDGFRDSLSVPELMDQLAGDTEATAPLIIVMLLAPVVIVVALIATWPTGYGPRILARVGTAVLVITMLAVHFAAGEILQETFDSDLAFGIIASIVAYLIVLVGALIGPGRQRRP